MRINSKEELQSKKAEIEQNIQSFTCRVLVCSGTGCMASGAQKIYDEMVRLCEGIDGVEIEMQKDIPHVGVIKTGCQGLCELGPLVRIEPYGYQYVHVQEEDCLEIVERTVRLGHPVDRLFYRHGDEICPKPEDIPFLNRQTRIVLENCGKIDAESIDEYIAAGGFSALAKAVTEMTPQDVIDEVTRSGLRGRGGAGFPAGKKWSQVARQAEKTRYVVCNGDEGDPGAFMDGSVMEGDPYKMIEGMIIAAYAVGAENGYIYVRAEYPLSVARLRLAISQAEKYGLLGDHILGSGVNFHLHINRGAGAFVCGEGSALTSSIEGNRGMPRVKPPRTVEKGLWGKPTVLNNVETYANVPKIIIQGADWFHTIGTEGSPGTKTFSLTGAIENTGLIEVPMGTTLREIIYDIGGGLKSFWLASSQIMPVAIAPDLYPGVVVITMGPSWHIHRSCRDSGTSHYIYHKDGFLTTAAYTASVNFQCGAGTHVRSLVHHFSRTPVIDFQCSFHHGLPLDLILYFFPEIGTAWFDFFIICPMKKHVIQEIKLWIILYIRGIFPEIDSLLHIIQISVKGIVSHIAVGHIAVQIFHSDHNIRT